MTGGFWHWGEFYAVITWPIVPGWSYQVQYKNDVSDPGWQSLNGNVTYVGSYGFATDLSPAAGQRFYRVVGH